MADACCICGVALATKDHDFPDWRQDIRAICRLGYERVVSDRGYVDGKALPFKFLIPSRGEPVRFTSRGARTPAEAGDYCYPFHEACWILLQDRFSMDTRDNYDEVLFNLFDSLHYNVADRSLKWEHDYYIEETAAQARQHAREAESISPYEAVPTQYADPLRFFYQEKRAQERVVARRPSPCFWPPADVVKNGNRLSLLPSEVFASILSLFSFRDVQQLRRTCRHLYDRCGGSTLDLPLSFWERMSHGDGETAFGNSLRPDGYTWKEWFFTMKSEVRDGPRRMSLYNRKRIWRLCGDLYAIARKIGDPRRSIHGYVASPDLGVSGPFASCLALPSSPDGRRELSTTYVPFETSHGSQGSQICAVAPHYIVISNRRLISGLTFLFQDGRLVDAGYVAKRPKQIDFPVSLQSLRLLFSQHGFEAMEMEMYEGQPTRLPPELASARWPSNHVKGIWLGLDAVRIVRMGLDTFEYSQYNSLAWIQPYPQFHPSFFQTDVPTLCELQCASFAPLSTLTIPHSGNPLVGIKVYSDLGSSAGISGIGFVYQNNVEETLGSADNAFVSFFLGAGEKLTRLTYYRQGPLICHLEFGTTSHRTSGRLPQMQVNSPTLLECITFTTENDGHITGICGCFVEGRLHRLGVIATRTARMSQSKCRCRFRSNPSRRRNTAWPGRSLASCSARVTAERTY